MVRPVDRAAAPEFGPIARTTISQEIVLRVVEMIEAGELQPGAPLPSERVLCDQLGVARTSVREALKALALFGIVEARPGGGTFIATDRGPLITPFAWRMLLSGDRVHDLVEARRVIEGQLAADAAVRRSLDQLATLRSHLEAMASNVDDRRRFLEADLGFHLEVAAMGGNTVLKEVLVALRSLLQRFVERVLGAEPRRGAETALRHHRRIYDAIAAGDPIEARRAMGDHLVETGERLLLVEHERRAAAGRGG